MIKYFEYRRYISLIHNHKQKINGLISIKKEYLIGLKDG